MAETDFVKAIGDVIGFGRVMQLAQQAWREVLIKKYDHPGGEFSIGPCVSLTVPCECKYGMCDWCCGSGWLTKHVKKMKDQYGGEEGK